MTDDDQKRDLLSGMGTLGAALAGGMNATVQIIGEAQAMADAAQPRPPALHEIWPDVPDVEVVPPLLGTTPVRAGQMRCEHCGHSALTWKPVEGLRCAGCGAEVKGRQWEQIDSVVRGAFRYAATLARDHDIGEDAGADAALGSFARKLEALADADS